MSRRPTDLIQAGKGVVMGCAARPTVYPKIGYGGHKPAGVSAEPGPANGVAELLARPAK